MASSLSRRYGAPAIAVDCALMDENTVKGILAAILFEFPIREIHVDIPGWLQGLEKENWLRRAVFGSIRERAKAISRIRAVQDAAAYYKLFR